MDTLTEIKLTLEKLMEVHDRLLHLAQEKQVFLVKGDVLALQQVISKESICVEQIEKLESARKQQLFLYFSSKGKVIPSATIHDLIQTLDDSEQRSAWEQCAGQLLQTIEEISSVNRINQQLTQMSMSYIQYSLGLLIKREPTIGYGPQSMKRNPSLLDARI